MSDRERWVVYPLLLLAIGLAMRNNVEMQDEGHDGEADVVRCRALEVLGPEGKPTVTISTSPKGDGVLEIGNAGGELQSRLGANAAGATLELLDREGKIYALVGHDADRVGLFAGDTESARVLSLISVVSHPPATEQKSTTPNKNPEGEGKPATPDKAAPENGNSGDKNAAEGENAAKSPAASDAPKESAPAPTQK